MGWVAIDHIFSRSIDSCVEVHSRQMLQAPYNVASKRAEQMARRRNATCRIKHPDKKNDESSPKWK